MPMLDRALRAEWREHFDVAPNSIYGAALCSGSHGIEIGLDVALPGYRPVVVVERETDCAARMAARRAEGSTPEVAHWSDIETFDGAPWRGLVDFISTGFPCQPFSLAGKRKGTDDERWIWPDIRRIIAEIAPAVVFIENVPGLLLDAAGDASALELDESADEHHGGAGAVFRDLAELGFDAEWDCFTASDVGAAHRRKRVFILAYNSDACGILERVADAGHTDRRTAHAQRRRNSGGPRASGDAGGTNAVMVHAAGPGLQVGRSERRDVLEECAPTFGTSNAMAHASRHGEHRPDGQAGGRGRRGTGVAGELVGTGFGSIVDALGGIFAPGPDDSRWNDVLVRNRWLRPALASAEVEPSVCDLADGMADLVVEWRTDALRQAGNGVVPLQAAVAFTVLAHRALAWMIPDDAT